MIRQTITEVIRKELAPIKLEIANIKREIIGIKDDVALVKQDIEAIKLDILGIKDEQHSLRDQMSKLELEFHKFRVVQERQNDNIAVVIENIKTAAENRRMLLNHDKRIKKLETA